MKKRFSYITPVIFLLSWVSLLTDISSEMLFPVLPVYLKTIGYSFLYIGLLEGFADATAGISKGYFGNMSDKLGRRVVFIRGGYALSVIGKSLLIFSQQVVGIFMARFTDRLGKGIRTSARDALLASQTKKQNLAAVFGFHRSMDTTGAVLGPIIALILLHYFPGRYQLIFVISLLPALLSVFFTFMLKEIRLQDEKQEKSLSQEEKRVPGVFSYLGYWKHASKQYRSLVLPLLLFAIVNSTDAFLLLRVKAAGNSDLTMISCYIAYNLIYALLSFPIGIFADKFGRINVLCIGLLLFAVSYFGFAGAESATQFFILFFIYALFSACNESVVKALLSAQCEEKERATALGFYESGRSLSSLVASTWTGLLWSFGNAALAFYISAITTVVVIVFIVKFDKLKNDRKEIVILKEAK